MHTPVLFEHVMEALNVQPSKQYIDATLGEGGFTHAITQRGGQVLALDWDEEQIKQVQQNIETDKHIKFATANFADIASVAHEYGWNKVDGIIFDLGLSMRQIAESGRGFSYKKLDEPLDMRINRGATSVSEYINSYTFDELYEIVSKYSEELNSRAIVQSLVRARHIKPIQTVGDLMKVINSVLDTIPLIKKKEREKVYARVFQAFRIAANNELENLKKALEGAIRLLDTKGVLVIITFHSLEDRIVKQYARKHGLYMKDIQKKKHVPSFERSARVRIIRPSQNNI